MKPFIQAIIAAVLLSTAAGMTSTFTVGVLVFFGVMFMWYSMYAMFIVTRDNMILMHKSLFKKLDIIEGKVNKK